MHKPLNSEKEWLSGSVIISLGNLRPSLEPGSDEFFWYITGYIDGGVGAWMKSMSANDSSSNNKEENIKLYLHIWI